MILSVTNLFVCCVVILNTIKQLSLNKADIETVTVMAFFQLLHASILFNYFMMHEVIVSQLVTGGLGQGNIC